MTEYERWIQKTTHLAYRAYRTQVEKEDTTAAEAMGLQLTLFRGNREGTIGIKLPAELLRTKRLETGQIIHYMPKETFDRVRKQIPNYTIGKFLYFDSFNKRGVFAVEPLQFH